MLDCILSRADYGGGKRDVHRKVWSSWNEQEIPAGMEVRHKCDNRRCIEPTHLEIGTHADNMRDMKERGRGANAEYKGKPKSAGFGDKQRQAQLTSRMRECECEMKTNAGSMANHQKVSGHGSA